MGHNVKASIARRIRRAKEGYKIRYCPSCQKAKELKANELCPSCRSNVSFSELQALPKPDRREPIPKKAVPSIKKFERILLEKQTYRPGKIAMKIDSYGAYLLVMAWILTIYCCL